MSLSQTQDQWCIQSTFSKFQSAHMPPRLMGDECAQPEEGEVRTVGLTSSLLGLVPSSSDGGLILTYLSGGEA